MVEVEIIRSISARSIGVMMSFLCTFLFQTYNATTSSQLTSIEAVINNITQVKKNTNRNYTHSSLTTHSHKVAYPLANNHNCLYFTICDDCNWCASRIMDKIKFYWCPSCQGSKIPFLFPKMDSCERSI
jgi:hypothetical protein